MRWPAALVFASALSFPIPCLAAPVHVITPGHSWIKFRVRGSDAISGKFDEWDASLEFTSVDESKGTLVIKIQADSVDTGSGIKNRKLKGKDFFDVKNYPEITFTSTNIVQTDPQTYEVVGDFTMRGVTKPEKLTLKICGKGTGSEEISGNMALNRRDYGMDKGVALMEIGDYIDVTLHLTGEQAPVSDGQQVVTTSRISVDRLQ